MDEPWRPRRGASRDAAIRSRIPTTRRTRRCAREDGKIRGIQFHPEVVHTPCGTQVLRNFVHKICGEPGDWTMANFVETKVAEIREPASARATRCCSAFPAASILRSRPR